ncbi:hypothetical protein GOP47_0022541 [Adiantum capillus-veneris]|uniref:HMA domain-containing protein n=1 Tax=Adiantum capillus-veneris TaxID=13818 RepID=A0A9D4Z649_ADICA|nr:hypothetical protein GOP47_0022541 [Adiantum capillus-veneris]
MPEEEKKEDDKIILQVDMHCEGCKAKVRKALKEFKGIEALDVNMQDQKVTIKGKLDARTVYETVKKKSGKRTILLYPDLSKVPQEPKKEEPKKEEPPPDPEVVVVLKVNMHCAACAKQIRRSLLKMDGVTDAKEDFSKSLVTVTGKKLDPIKLCARVKKRSGKHCEIVPPPPPPPAPPKEEEKKEEAKPAEEKKEEVKPAEEAKKEEEKPADAAPAAAEAAPPAAEGEKKAEEKKEEEKKDAPPAEKPEEKKEVSSEETKTEVKKYEYNPYRSHVPEYYVYPPQLFSDENPNACSIM